MRIEDFNDEYVAAMVQRRLDLLCPEDRLLAEAMATIPGPAPAQAGSPRRLAKITGSYTQARAALRRSLNVVRLVARSLGSTPGRKSLVLVTEGFPTDPSVPGFREVREEAARANVVIHFLDARGLATGFPEFLSAAGSTRVPPGDVAQTIALWRLEDAGAKTLAEETGGLVLQTNDLVSGLMKVADESRVTYLLGYEPTNEKRDGRYRALKVEVRRPGLQVRARAGYFAPKGKEQPAPPRSPVQRAFGNVFDADGIPLRLAAYVMGEAPVQSPMATNGREVLIAGELRLDALEAQVKGGRRVAEPRLELLTGSRSGESHESEWTLEITLGAAVGAGAPAAAATSAAGDALWHPFVTRIAMTPGDHRARLVVQSGDRVGSVTVDFIVPPLTEERLSTPILSDRLVAGPSERRVLPLARRAFDSTSTLHCWVELEGAALDTATGQPRAQAGFVVRSLDGREWASGPATAMNVDGGKVARLLSVPLADAPPGEQELILRVKDEVSGATLETREPFRVEVSPGGRAATLAGASDTLSTPSPDVVAGTPGAPPAATQTPAPPPPRAAPPIAPPAQAALTAATPTFPADTQVVVLDLVARDGRGQLVSDLRADELQVFEDGKRCKVESFRRVTPRRAPRSRSGYGPAADGWERAGDRAPQPSAPSRANVVVLLFDSLGVEVSPERAKGRARSSRTGASRRTPGSPCTSPTGSGHTAAAGTDEPSRPPARRGAHRDRRRRREAPRPGGAAGTPRDPRRLRPGSSARRWRPRRIWTARAGTGEAGTFAAAVKSSTPSPAYRRSCPASPDVRGRKAIVYFAADHELGGGEISGGRASLAYASGDERRQPGERHRAHRGRPRAHVREGRRPFGLRPDVRDRRGRRDGRGRGRQCSRTAATDTDAPDKGGAPLLGDPERVLSPAPEKFLSIHSGSLLEHVAEETGGLAITKTNDLAAGLVRVIDELREYYEVVYTPPRDSVFDGRFRRIEAKVSRRGVQVRTRAGYFATAETTPTIPRSSLR